MDRSADVLWIVSGAIFLESSGIHPNLLVTRKRLLCVNRVGCMWHVGRVFPYRVYIDSNHHDSQI
jgi:hypothetical protein